MRRWRGALLPPLAIAAAVALLGASGVALSRLSKPLPPLSLRVAFPASATLAGPPPPIPLPAQGSLELETLAGDVLAQQDPDTVRPTGSIAKVMTALLVLQAHPLAPGATGPVLTLTQADADLYQEAVAEGGSAVAVRAGEALSERDLLLALLLPSANNIAETLAVWVAGTRAAFIAELNSAAAQLGMEQTHFDDPSGYSALTVSTARDLVILGRAALANAALAQLLATPSATLPDGTALQNLDLLLQRPGAGWLGLKTGWTPAAGGCLLFAAQHLVATGTTPVTVVGAVLGQPPLPAADPLHPELGGALRSALSAASAALAGYISVRVDRPPVPVSGELTSAWAAPVPLELAAGTRPLLVLREPVQAGFNLLQGPLSAPLSRGDDVARLQMVLGSITLSWPLQLEAPLSRPGSLWQLEHQG